jgi:hypothetical protein
MQQRSERPQQRQSTRQIADRVGTCVATVMPIDDVHLFHQIFVTEIWVPLGDTSVVQREKAEATSPKVEPPEIGHLGAAEIALAVVNDDVSSV